MADEQNGPFDRTANGYDPRQVAVFAAEALTWKRNLASCRAELRTATQQLERYEAVIGTIDDIEREAAEITEQAKRSAAGIIRQAENEAARILEVAASSKPIPPSTDTSPTDHATADAWPDTADERDQRDRIEEIFETLDQTDEDDPTTDRERRIEAAKENLWKRRGVLTPPQ